MKKIIYLTIIFLMGINTLIAQEGILPLSASHNFNTNTNYLRNADELIGVEGSPYFNEDPVESILTDAEGKKYSAFMKYNIYKDRMEFASSKNFDDRLALPTTSDFIIDLGQTKFKFMDLGAEANIDGYFEILAFDLNKNPILVKRRTQVIKIPDARTKNSYQASSNVKTLRLSNEYYMNVSGRWVSVDNHKRRALKAFPDNVQSTLKSYIKSEDLDFDDDNKAIIALVEEFNRIK